MVWKLLIVTVITKNRFMFGVKLTVSIKFDEISENFKQMFFVERGFQSNSTSIN